MVVLDAHNCYISSAAQVPVCVGLPVAGFTLSSSGLEVDFTNTSQVSTSYLWRFGDGISSTAANPSHTYPQNGDYTVMLIATNQCGSDTAIRNTGGITGIDNIKEGSYSLNLFPNPNNGSFTLQLESAQNLGELSIRLFSVDGKLLDDVIGQPNGKLFSKNFNYELTAGVYVLEVTNGDRVLHQRIVVR